MKLHLGSQVVSRIRFCLVSLFLFFFLSILFSFLFGGRKRGWFVHRFVWISRRECLTTSVLMICEWFCDANLTLCPIRP